MAPIVVDPYALSGAGASVSAVGDGLSAAVSVLAGSFDANTGADSAGAVFGRQYVSAADAILKSVSAGVNACRNVGYGIGVSAANYSRADADSDISGRSQPLASPPCPAPVSAPRSPRVLGGGVAVPALWFVVQAFVGDLWPSGDPAGMRQAAAAWRVFEVSLRDVGVDVSGPDTTVGAQRIGEGAQIRGALREIGTGLSEAASQCEQLASGLEGFAAGVEHTQQAIRDLLGKLGSIGGVVGTFFEFVRGHGEEEFHRIVADIRTVLHHLKAEADAKKELAAQGLAALDSGALRLQAWADREFVDLFGERVGNAFATQFNNTVDSAEGGVRWLASTADGVAALDPTRFAYDPEGAKQTWQGLADFANVLSNPVGAYHADPEKMQTILNGLARTDEWSKGRPALALTENALDLLTLGVPGLGEAGAAGDAASVAGRLSRAGGIADQAGVAGKAAAKVGEIDRGAGAVVNIGKGTTGITEKLDGIAAKPVTAEPPPVGGRPVSQDKPADPVAASLTKQPMREGVPAGDYLGTRSHASGATEGTAGAIGHRGQTDGELAGGANGRHVDASRSSGASEHVVVADHPPGTERGPDQPWDIPPLLEREVPYETGGIQPEYVGEQYPDGPMGSPGVHYLSEADRERYRITIRDGLLCDPRGNLCDTSGGVSAFGPYDSGRAIFVMDEHGNVYASRLQTFRPFSSLEPAGRRRSGCRRRNRCQGWED